jgi:hypothetical protein
MADEKTRADSLRMYLTGATSDGGAQTDPDASLGNYRSSTLETFFDVDITNPISNVTVDHVSGAHAEGSGSLTTKTVDSLAWTPPGGSEGPEVTILNGETKVLEGSGVPGQFIRVTRTSATALSGTATLDLTYTFNNVVGYDDVSAAEASAGDTEYRAVMIKNESAAGIESVKAYLQTLGTNQVSGAAQLPASGAGTIGLSSGNFNDWPTSGFTRIETSGGTLREIAYYTSRTSTVLTVPAAGRGLLGTSAQAGTATDVIMAVPGCRIAKEAPVSDAIQTIANESTSPTGRTWSTAVSSATGVDIGNMATTALYGIWFERVVPVGATSLASVKQAIALSFDGA